MYFVFHVNKLTIFLQITCVEIGDVFNHGIVSSIAYFAAYKRSCGKVILQLCVSVSLSVVVGGDSCMGP